MPVVSKAQNRLMHAAAAKKGGAGGVSQKVGKEFVAAGKAKPKLPEKAKPIAAMKSGVPDRKGGSVRPVAEKPDVERGFRKMGSAK